MRCKKAFASPGKRKRNGSGPTGERPRRPRGAAKFRRGHVQELILRITPKASNINPDMPVSPSLSLSLSLSLIHIHIYIYLCRYIYTIHPCLYGMYVDHCTAILFMIQATLLNSEMLERTLSLGIWFNRRLQIGTIPGRSFGGLGRCSESLLRCGPSPGMPEQRSRRVVSCLSLGLGVDRSWLFSELTTQVGRGMFIVVFPSEVALKRIFLYTRPLWLEPFSGWNSRGWTTKEDMTATSKELGAMSLDLRLN